MDTPSRSSRRTTSSHHPPVQQSVHPLPLQRLVVHRRIRRRARNQQRRRRRWRQIGNISFPLLPLPPPLPSSVESIPEDRSERLPVGRVRSLSGGVGAPRQHTRQARSGRRRTRHPQQQQGPTPRERRRIAERAGDGEAGTRGRELSLPQHIRLSPPRRERHSPADEHARSCRDVASIVAPIAQRRRRRAAAATTGDVGGRDLGDR